MDTTTAVGKSVARIDAADKVVGRVKFFSQAGLKALTLLPFKVPQQLVEFYHQKWDGPVVLTMEPLLNVLKLTFEWVRNGGEHGAGKEADAVCNGHSEQNAVNYKKKVSHRIASGQLLRLQGQPCSVFPNLRIQVLSSQVNSLADKYIL